MDTPLLTRCADVDRSTIGDGRVLMYVSEAGMNRFVDVGDIDGLVELIFESVSEFSEALGQAAFLNVGTTAGTVAAGNHTHAIGDVTNLQTSLDGKAANIHTHAISDVTNLQTVIDGKAPTANPTFTGTVGVVDINASGAVTAAGGFAIDSARSIFGSSAGITYRVNNGTYYWMGTTSLSARSGGAIGFSPSTTNPAGFDSGIMREGAGVVKVVSNTSGALGDLIAAVGSFNGNVELQNTSSRFRVHPNAGASSIGVTGAVNTALGFYRGSTGTTLFTFWFDGAFYTAASGGFYFSNGSTPSAPSSDAGIVRRSAGSGIEIRRSTTAGQLGDLGVRSIFSEGPICLSPSTVGTQPSAAAYPRGEIYFTDGLKSGETSGSGTGIPAWSDGTIWRTFYDNQEVAA